NPDGDSADDKADESKADGEKAAEAGSDESDDEGDGDLPERVKNKLNKVNEEAKGLRVKLRQAEDKLKEAKTSEEVEAIVNQMTKDREESEQALLRENVALKFKLPETAAKRLAGATREELEADAKELAELFAAAAEEDPDLEGGLNPR